jgi:hypothetical protein
MSERTIFWTGKSGKKYKHWIYPIEACFKKLAGNYLFARETRPGHWVPIYVGESDSLGERLPNHERLKEAIRLGASHVHAHLNSGSMIARMLEEFDLIQRWNPPLNVQGKPQPTRLQALLRQTPTRNPSLRRS